MNLIPLRNNVEVNSINYATRHLITSSQSTFFNTYFFLRIFYSAFEGMRFPLMAYTASVQDRHFLFPTSTKNKHISARKDMFC